MGGLEDECWCVDLVFGVLVGFFVFVVDGEVGVVVF